MKRLWIIFCLSLFVAITVGVGTFGRGPELFAPGLEGQRKMRMVIPWGRNTPHIYHSVYAFKALDGSALRKLDETLKAQGFKKSGQGESTTWDRGTEDVFIMGETRGTLRIGYHRDATPVEAVLDTIEGKLGRR